MEYNNLFAFLFLIVFIIGGSVIILEGAIQTTEDKVVKCFDDNQNEMIGQSCLDKGTTTDEKIVMLFLGIFIIIMGFVFAWVFIYPIHGCI